MSDLIEFDRERRTMDVDLTPAELQDRADRLVLAHEAREALEAKLKTAKSTVGTLRSEIAEKAGEADRLAKVIRDKKEPTEVEIERCYDPKTQEVVEIRADTRTLTRLGRAPRAGEMDLIRPLLQTSAVPDAPCRAPREIPHIDLALLADLDTGPQPLTMEVVGYRLRKIESCGGMTEAAALSFLLGLVLPGATDALTPAEREAFAAGVRKAAEEQPRATQTMPYPPAQPAEFGRAPEVKPNVMALLNNLPPGPRPQVRSTAFPSAQTMAQDEPDEAQDDADAPEAEQSTPAPKKKLSGAQRRKLKREQGQ